MAILRQETLEGDRWNVSVLYPSLEAWEQAFIAVETESDKHSWPALQAYKGTLAQGSEGVKGALELYFNVSRTLDKLYTYAHLRHDEDLADEHAKAAYLRILNVVYDFRQRMAWLEPELLELPEAAVEGYQADATLDSHRFYLERLFRLRQHTLSADKEALLALTAKALQTPHKAFSALNNADFVFGTVTDEQGQSCELTHATYGLYQRRQDRILRANSFVTMHGKFRDYQNTLAELLQGAVQGHLVQAEARGYSSCLEAALFPNNIDVSVYHSLIAAVRSNLDVLHRYISLREKVLGLPNLHLYDMSVPLVTDMDIKMDYMQAQQTVIDSVAPLGSEYQGILRRGLIEERWVDRYENKGKRSGAYSSGCYDSYPYILMNYNGVLRDVFTLAHEAGHSMHSYLSHSHQPYHYSDYSIFVAEVASTFNEQLLTHLLLERTTSRTEKIVLINEQIEALRGTLFRQTMFAEFELFVHQAVEQRQPLTPQFLCEHYKALNSAYFGPTVTIDAVAEVEWARIPHFYYNFYVYQYATGISAAIALADRVLQGGEEPRAAYLQFLQGGSSAYPLELLRRAGVDMCTPAPVAAAITYFRTLVTQLEELLS